MMSADSSNDVPFGNAAPPRPLLEHIAAYHMLLFFVGTIGLLAFERLSGREPPQWLWLTIMLATLALFVVDQWTEKRRDAHLAPPDPRIRAAIAANDPPNWHFPAILVLASILALGVSSLFDHTPVAIAAGVVLGLAVASALICIPGPERSRPSAWSRRRL